MTGGDKKEVDHTLEFLLAFDGRIHELKDGYSLKFEIKKVGATPTRPHGLSYSLTMHDPDGNRILGFDNAHGVRFKGSKHAKKPEANDHWHRQAGDEGRPYAFQSADQLIADFFTEVNRVCEEQNITDDVVGTRTRTTKRTRP